MKKFEAKTTLLLALPALALLGFASLMSLRQQRQSKPQIVSHTVERVPNTNVWSYRVIVTKNELPWWNRTLLGGRDYGAKTQGTMCDQLVYLSSQPLREDANCLSAESLFLSSNLRDDAVVPKSDVVFRTMITWKQSDRSTTRDASYVLRETVPRQNFK